MAVTINVNGLSLIHKGSGGVANATCPDVCKTPTPGGAVMVPYPNTAFSKDLAKGSKLLSVDGGNPAAMDGSEFSRSIGDEPGTAKGVKSGVNMHRATWLSYSFDVRIEGKGACRLTDKMLMNNGNTVCLAGVLNPTVPDFQPPKDPRCAALYEKIFRDLYALRTKPRDGLQGLARRWNDTSMNRDGWSVEKNRGHMQAYGDQQNRLNKTLDKWDKQNCDDKDLPPGTRMAADEKPVLGSKQDWDTRVYKNESSSMDNIAKALGVSVGFVVAVEVITRLIRLFPPLLPLQASPI